MDPPLRPAEIHPDADLLQKKRPRQWAAWTHLEEESFFNALRQVGKNFEKIMVHVQTKNKDQVRHYYYRLLRRLNKLLGPGFSIDTKNSKDIIAAMLRWWSLLEKFDCSASKLHLKPGRYKTFVQALGKELLKDRNKTKRKCPQGALQVPSQSPILSQTQGSGSFPVEVHSVDAPNSSKIAAPKGASLKQFVDAKPNALRSAKQKRTSCIDSAAYENWERAAMDGVALVADAAQQLEFSLSNQSLPFNADKITSTSSLNYLCAVNGTGMNLMREADLQPSAKLKLQLFPVNEATRKALEKDEHNPYLELTLSPRKKISSVLEHLHRKWGSPNIVSGELMLLPYSAHVEDLASYQRWTMKDTATIADVFLSVNSPSIFRLRYGWLPLAELEAGVGEINSTHFENCMIPEGIKSCKDNTLINDCMPEQQSDNPKDQTTLVCDMVSRMGRDVELPEQSINTFSTQCDRQKQVQSCAAIPEVEWTDSLTNISVGYLLAETSRVASDCPGPSRDKDALYNENSFDSFDAAVAFNVSRCQAAARPVSVSHPTIWGVEETCDAFRFSLAALRKQEVTSTSASSPPESIDAIHPHNSKGFHGFLQDLAGADPAKDPLTCADNMKDDVEAWSANSVCHTDTNAVLKDQSLADIYWPDSLGPLDLEMPSSGYQAHDMFTDSRNGWSCMMESSLDSFRNLPFFTMDKNNSIPSVDM